jgi:hypothetical protein
VTRAVAAPDVRVVAAAPAPASTSTAAARGARLPEVPERRTALSRGLPVLVVVAHAPASAPDATGGGAASAARATANAASGAAHAPATTATILVVVGVLGVRAGILRARAATSAPAAPAAAARAAAGSSAAHLPATSGLGLADVATSSSSLSGRCQGAYLTSTGSLGTRAREIISTATTATRTIRRIL